MPVLSLLLLACPLTQDLSAPASTHRGEHFTLHVHFPAAPALAREALAVAETAYPLAEALFGPPKPQASLDIHLLRDSASYQSVEARLTRGNFRDNLAFSSYVTLAAYVALQPDCDDATLARVGLTDQTRHQIAHEACHVVCYNALESHPYHPTWLSEGAASWVGEEAMRRGGWSDGIEADPYTSKSLLMAQLAQRAGRLPPLGDLLRAEPAELDAFERYAAWSLAFRFLYEYGPPEPLARTLQHARELGRGFQFSRRLYDFAGEAYGEELFAELDADFARFVERLRPEWDQTGRSLETNGSEWVQVPFPGRPAIAWSTHRPAGEDYELRGAVEVLSGRGMTVLIARLARQWLELELVPGERATLRRFTWGGRDAPGTTVLGQVPLTGPADAPLSFRVLAEPRRLTVHVADAAPITVELRRGELCGAYGLAAPAGAGGVWHDVELRER